MDKPEKLSKGQLVFIIVAAVIAGISCYPPISTLYDFEQYDQPIGILPLLGLTFTAILIGFHFARRMRHPVYIGILAASFVSEWASIYNLPVNMESPEALSGLATLVFVIAIFLATAGIAVTFFIERGRRSIYLGVYLAGLFVFAMGQYITYMSFSGIRY